MDATEQLQQQRDDVRRAAEDILVGAEKALPGRTSTSVGRWDGCESAFPEGFATFQYVGQAKVEVDTGSATEAPYLEPLRPVLEDAGFAVEGPTAEPNGWMSLTATKGEISAAFVHSGAGAFVGLTISGPCVDVPKDDRDAWQTRHDPAPLR